MAPRFGDMGPLTDKPELVMSCLSIGDRRLANALLVLEDDAHA